MAEGISFSDFELPSPPQDPVSALAFSPTPSEDHSTRLIVSAWDRTVRLYSIRYHSPETAPTTELLHTFQHDAAVLDVCWINEDLAASASLDRRIRLLNTTTGQSQIIGKHLDAASRIRYNPETNLLISGSWDRTLKLWNPSPSEGSGHLLHTLAVPDKVLALDLSPPYTTSQSSQPPRAVVAMTGRIVHIFDLRSLRATADELIEARRALPEGETKTDEQLIDASKWAAEQTRESSLKFMMRDVRCTPSGEGYATSSVEGRIAVDFFDPEEAAKKYAFKCHRQDVEGIETIYPVNAMSFHPIHGTFASIGGDAMCSLWDAGAKKRIRQYTRLPSPLSSGAFSPDGLYLALASGAENIEDTRHPGPGAGEVGEIGRGGEGNVKVIIKAAWEDCKPKAKTA